jgi:hypothetical protein
MLRRAARASLALLGIAVFASACSSSSDATPTTSARVDGGSDGGDSGAEAAAPRVPASCALRAVVGAAAVTPTFANLAPPSVVVPTMTGGTVAGRFKFTRAAALLPAETASFVDPTKSSGSVTAWAVFEESSYRLHLDVALVVATSVSGNQAQTTSVDSQGTWTTSAASLVLDPSCDTATPAAAEYSFTGTPGSLSLLIKTKVGPFASASYLQLDGVPE